MFVNTLVRAVEVGEDWLPSPPPLAYASEVFWHAMLLSVWAVRLWGRRTRSTVQSNARWGLSRIGLCTSQVGVHALGRIPLARENTTYWCSHPKQLGFA